MTPHRLTPLEAVGAVLVVGGFALGVLAAVVPVVAGLAVCAVALRPKRQASRERTYVQGRAADLGSTVCVDECGIRYVLGEEGVEA